MNFKEERSKTLIEMLYATAERHSDQVAIVYGTETMSYRDLLDQVERLAHGLAALGVGVGDRVALVHPNSPEFVLTFFAVTALGAVVVPLDPRFPEAELLYYFQKSNVCAAITDGQHATICERLLSALGNKKLLLVTDSAPGDMATDFWTLVNENPPLGISPCESGLDAVYQFSSGSTGRAKRVSRTQEQCWWEAGNFVTTTRLTVNDRIFCAIPLFHTYGQGDCLLAAARSGATLLLLERPNPFALMRYRALDMLESQKATVFPGVPEMFRLLAETETRADLSSLRLCISGGVGIPFATFESFRTRFQIPIRQQYGCTEAGVLTVNMDSDPAPSAASVGVPIEGVKIKIVDGQRHAVPQGEVGEIVISTAAITRGYYQLEEHNREVFRDGCFATGDLGRVDDEGRLWITGRKKLFISVAGNKVDPAEVEDVIATHPHVQEVVVIGVPGEIAGEEIVKAVVVRQGLVNVQELSMHCRNRLASFKVPQHFEFRDEIPKNPMGKILRDSLIHAASAAQTGIKMMDYQTAIERYLLNTYFANSPRRQIDFNESLLTLGILDSLAFVQLISFFQSEFHVIIEDADVTPENFETIQAIEALISRTKGRQPS